MHSSRPALAKRGTVRHMMHMHDMTSSTCACTALRKATRTLTRHYDEHMAAHGLTTSQFAILRNIDRAEDIALSELADRLVMDRTTLYRALRPLEAAGWVKTRPAPRGHIRLARLTSDGRATMHAAEPAWEASQAELLAALGDSGWQQLHEAAAGVVALKLGTRA
jgi:DNA-binding MarR family transcriptional regulator